MKKKTKFKQTEIGIIPSNWKIVELNDVCSKITDGSHGSPPTVQDGELIATVKDMGHGGFVYSSCRKISEHDYKQLIKNDCRPLKNDVLIAKDGSFLKHVFVADKNEDLVILSSIAIIRPNLTKIDPHFLKYIFLTNKVKKRVSTNYVTGGVIQRIVLKDFKKILIALPPLSEQKQISKILLSLDKKIEINHIMNSTLENMAQVLFKLWFVDFEPVRSKMSGCWKQGKSLPGMPAHFYDLFPSTLVNSELGEIPKGWTTTTLSGITNVVGGTTPNTKIEKYWNGGTINWATPKDLSKLHTHVLLKTKRKITREGAQQISSGILPIGTVLLSSRAPIGYLAITEVPVAINQGFIAMLPLECITNQFLLYWCKIHQKEIINHANGSVFLEINKKNFKQIPLINPDTTTMHAFHSITSKFHQMIVSNEKISCNIMQLRDSLLQKLLFGKIRISMEAEH